MRRSAVAGEVRSLLRLSSAAESSSTEGGPGPGVITSVAGTGIAGFTGDGGQAIDAALNAPVRVEFDAAGNLYIADRENHRVRKVDASTRRITTVAGTGEEGDSGDGGPATSARLRQPQDVAFDATGNMYIADIGTNTVRKVDAGTGTITRFAGSGEPFGSGPPFGDGGPAVLANIDFPWGIDVDAAGNVYIADGNHGRIRKVNVSGTITSVSLPSGPRDVVATDAGELYVTTAQNRVHRINTSGAVTAVAGTGAFGYSGDGGPPLQATLFEPRGITLDGSGNLFVADVGNHRIRKIAPGADGVVNASADEGITTVAGSGSTVFGGFSGDGGSPLEAQLNRPEGVLADAAGNLWIADTENHRLRRVTDDRLEVRVRHTPEPVFVGTQFVYTADVKAFTGATSVTLNMTLPGGVTMSSITATQGTCSPSGATVNCALGNLAGGQTVTVTVLLTSPAAPVAVLTTATVAAAEPDGYPPNNTMAEPIAVAGPNDSRPGPGGLALAMTDAPDPLDAGETLTYSLVVTNNLPVPASNVTLSDAFPAGVVFVSTDPALGSCSIGGATLTCALGTLASGATLKGRIIVTPTVPGIITNSAAVTSAEADPDPSNNTATAVTLVSDPGCGRVITTNTVLSGDVGPCGGDGLVVGADNVTLDLGGHQVVGFAGPSNPDCFSLPAGTVCGDEAGVRLMGRTGVTVKNGTVTGFDAGVAVYDGGSNTLTSLTLHDNVGPDNAFAPELGDGIVLFDSADNTITHNTLRDNGRYDGIGVLGKEADGNAVEHNTVEDTLGPSDGGPAGQGIIFNAFIGISDGGTIAGSTISHNVIRGSGSAGITNFNNIEGVVEANTVVNNGVSNNNGNGIGVSLGPGSDVTATSMLVRDNEVHANSANGIQVGNGATGNQILDNDASDNAWREDEGGYDLSDQNAGCGTTTWSGNTWGGGGFSPVCTSSGGHRRPGPTPDFDGTGTTDIAVFRPGNGIWFAQGGATTAWGTSGDLPVPGDYDGNGTTDVAVFRPGNSIWFVCGGATTAWGTSGDIPVPGDYDGNGTTDIAVFRPAQGLWFVQGGVTVAWGTSGDIPVPGDYDGDSTTDIAVFRPSQGLWFVRGGVTAAWGTAGDIPVPGDYDGNGITEVAVFRPSQGLWFVLGGAVTAWGTSGDIPLPGDYDGDGIADLGVFRPPAGLWFLKTSSTGDTSTGWGTAGDRPLSLPAAVYQSFLAP